MSVRKAFLRGFVIGAGLAAAPVIAWIVHLERGWQELDRRAELVAAERKRWHV